MDDAALVGAACQGDKQAFADIYDQYSDRIYSFLVSLTLNREDAADLLQDTFLTAAARLGQLRDPSKLRPWLYAIARHLAMKSFSRFNRHDSLEDLELIATAPEPSESAAQTELAALAGAAAEGLGAQDQVVLELHLRHGLQGQELGDALGVTAGHAYVLISRMRDQVERSLGALGVARQVSKDPISMLGFVPMMPAPTEARESILEQIRLVPHAGSSAGGEKNRYTSERWPGKSAGFPPPIVRRSRKTVAAVAAAALVLMLFTGSTVALVAEPEPPPSPPQVELSFDPDEVFQPPVPLPEPYQTVEVLEPGESPAPPAPP